MALGSNLRTNKILSLALAQKAISPDNNNGTNHVTIHSNNSVVKYQNHVQTTNNFPIEINTVDNVDNFPTEVNISLANNALSNNVQLSDIMVFPFKELVTLNEANGKVIEHVGNQCVGTENTLDGNKDFGEEYDEEIPLDSQSLDSGSSYDSDDKEDNASNDEDTPKEKGRSSSCKNAAKETASLEKLVLTMDLQSILLCPKTLTSAMYYKQKLQFHNFTIYELNRCEVSLYVWHEASEGDGLFSYAKVIESTIGVVVWVLSLMRTRDPPQPAPIGLRMEQVVVPPIFHVSPDTAGMKAYAINSKSKEGRFRNIKKSPGYPSSVIGVVYHRDILNCQETNPLEWGWKKGSSGLIPIIMIKDATPESLLKVVLVPVRKVAVDYAAAESQVCIAHLRQCARGAS
ncbi:hypothetical protein ILUMI_20997 [Ignelater luminosus]|uniref:Uncharacterized protein n=1 Tax=Ignelater luminosus TaxID=2038154 RepID=A0A8K0CGF4_IGNLU|nr:hypothetical protein ILUMI_20997 [Ignelater luminosus]